MKKTKTRFISWMVTLAMTLTAIPAIPASAAPDEGNGPKPLKLQYLSSADKGNNERNNWERWALPLGNGHIGAMVFGRTETERIQLNEKTLWSGGPGGADDAKDGEYTKRDPLSDAYGNVDAAGSGAMDKYIDTLFQNYYNGSTGTNSPAQSGDMKIIPNNRSALGDYLNFADMYMDFNHTKQDVKEYRRELDLRNALSTVSYDYNNVHYTREAFTNHPDNVMVYRITSDTPGSIDMVLRPIISDLGTTSGGHSKKVTKEGTVVADQDSKTITMEGKITNNDMKFAGKFQVVNQGGEVTAQNPGDQNSEGQLTIQDADSVLIYVSLATNYINKWPNYRQDNPDYAINYVTENIKKASEKGYDKLWQAHLEDYQELFSRVELDLGGVYNESEETDQLLKTWTTASSSGTQNHYLEELYFQYGRYLVISSSRSDTLPSNLQGIWNDRVFADWQSDYHTNINLQMNYWPVYSTNLAETGDALVNYVDSLQEPGTLTAEKLFGTKNAWMVNCSANALGFTGNINSSASLASTANAFILQNVYDHYQYTQDKTLLADTIYPMMTGACNFFLQTLQNGRTDADKDKLFMVPSFSSEHGPWTVGSTFDQQLIYMLFEDTLDAAANLGISDDFTAQLKDTMEKLYPINIGDEGQIKEWQQEGNYNRYKQNPSVKIGDDAHRHNSMLMALHPGNLITTETPELMEAAKTTLNKRGDAATGWSMGQKFNMWTRLQDGNHAYNKLFKNLMKNGTATNLFDLHPPFQIDGNFGGTAGIVELLMQSHAGYVSILPALPDELPTGSVKGLVAEGNFVVDLTWSNMKATDIQITSRSGNRLSLKCGPVRQIMDTTAGTPVTEISQDSNGAISFDTVAGHTYQVISGEEQALLYAQTVISDIENMGLVSYEYTTETGNEFTEAFLACKRMVEQQNYMEDGIEKTVSRLLDAVDALTLRGSEEYVTAVALHFLENASAVNYTDTDTEDQWRQQIEYDRADLMEALESGSQDADEMLAAAEKLVKSGNSIAGYSDYRINLFDFIKKAKTIQQDTRPDEVWANYNTAIGQAVKIFANPKATKKDLKNAAIRLKKVVETMQTVFTINASAEGSGSISPSGEVQVLGGTSQEFSITPDENGEILDVLVDGTSVGAVNDYTFDDVQKDMEIKALFQEIETPKTESEVLLDNAIARVNQLSGENYVKADWAAVEAALEEALVADRTDTKDMAAKAEALLTAMDHLHIWGEPERTEAEDGVYPVGNFSDASVYKDPSNWGDLPLGENKVLGGYPEGGPVKATGSAGSAGQWAKQSISGASKDSQVLCKTDGSWVKFKFDGPRVRYITESAATGAAVTVYIDDVEITTVNCWEPSSATNPRGVVRFDSEDYDLNLSDGTHELKLVGNTQPGSKHPIFRVDAFDEYKEILQVTPTKDLAALMAEVSTLQSISYTPETWQVLQEALQAAEGAIANPSADQQMITDALNALNTAKGNLKEDNNVVKEVTPLMPITVPYGITLEDLSSMLQQSVVVKAGSRNVRVDVKWNLDGFDGAKVGQITLNGDLILPEETPFQNPDGLKASVDVTVEKQAAKVTLDNLKQTEGSVTPVTAKTDPAGLKVTILYDGVETLPSAPGTYQVEATIVDPIYVGTALGSLTIEKKEDQGETDNTELEAARKTLQAELDLVKSIIQAGQQNYSSDSWNRFAKAYENAKAGLNATEKSVLDSLYTELRTALGALQEKAPVPEKPALNAPTISKVASVSTKSGLRIEITVKKVSDAASYNIYRQVYGKTVKVGSTTSGKFYDSKLYPGKTVRYRAVAVPKDTAKYADSKIGSGKNIKLKKFSGPVSISQKNRRVTLRWKKNSGAKGYAIYRADKKTGTYRLIKTLTKGSSLTYTDKKVKKGKRYYYKVAAKVGSQYTAYKSAKTIRIK